MLLTLVLLRAQRDIVQHFEQAGATAADSARTADELNLKPGIAWHQLVGHVVLRCPGEGRYYLDLANWERLRRQRRRSAWMVGVAVLVLLALLFWLRAAAA
ncbi:hypothetical protein SAMN05216570_0734 [Dyella sp. OK004]|uniref:hypothetical protein n=1 Tax=Dyella sp. OK004 TaxID=1855292 RepID=UPI0008E34504|nr:hypothetical protein [Dyella sp. OK004]SFR92786.1 hypothetical protein SAMN05216570_0734 [Dyella sp. OK004]